MTESMFAASTWFILDHKEWRSFLQVEANRENTCKEKSVFLEQENTSGSEVIPGPPTPCTFIFSCIKMCSRFVSRACCELIPRCAFCRRTWKDLYIRNSPSWQISHDFRIISRHTANLFSRLIFDPSRSHHLPPPLPLLVVPCPSFTPHPSWQGQQRGQHDAGHWQRPTTHRCLDGGRSHPWGEGCWW